MPNILLQAHSGWRYIVILALIVAVVKFLIGWFGKRPWTSLDQNTGLALTIVLDIQLLLGIVLWIARSQWLIADPVATWEHPITMIIAIAVAHIAWSRAKKDADPVAKFRTGTIGFVIAGLIIGLGIWRITSDPMIMIQ